MTDSDGLNTSNLYKHIVNHHPGHLLPKSLADRVDAKLARAGAAGKRGRLEEIEGDDAEGSKKLSPSDLREELVKYLILDMRPIAAGGSLGFSRFLRALGYEPVPTSSLYDVFNKLKGRFVDTPLATFIANSSKVWEVKVATTVKSNAVAVTVTQQKVSLLGRYQAITDGWATRTGSKAVSLLLSTTQLITEARGSTFVERLIPHSIPIALKWFDTAGGLWSGDRQAQLLAGAFKERNIDIGRILSIATDNEPLQLATIRSKHLAAGGLKPLLVPRADGPPGGYITDNGGIVGPLQNPCYGHLADLIAEDIAEDEDFAAVLAVVQKANTWLLSTAKHKEALTDVQRNHNRRTRGPIRPSETRFMVQVLTIARIYDVLQDLKQLDKDQDTLAQVGAGAGAGAGAGGGGGAAAAGAGGGGAGPQPKALRRLEPNSADRLRPIVLELQFMQKKAAALLVLCKTLVYKSPRLYVQNAYTISLVMPFFLSCQFDADAASKMNDGEVPCLPTLVDSFRKALWTRMAPVRFFARPDLPVGVAPLTEAERTAPQRLQFDEVALVGCALDPATYPFLKLTGGVINDILTFLVRLVRTSMSDPDNGEGDVEEAAEAAAAAAGAGAAGAGAGAGAGAAGGGGGGGQQMGVGPPAAAAAAAARPAELGFTYKGKTFLRVREVLSYIRSQPKPSGVAFAFMSDAAWRDTLEEEVVRFRNSNPGAVPQAPPLEMQTHIQTQLEGELTRYAECIAAEGIVSLNPTADGDNDSLIAAVCTLILDNNVPGRYEFWPKYRATLPLMYFCARQVLGMQLTSMGAESFHSSLGFIHSKYRSNLTPKNLESLAVAREMLKRMEKDEPLLRVEGGADYCLDDGAVASLERLAAGFGE